MKVLNQVSLTELGITLNYATNEINLWTTRLLEKKHLDESDKKGLEDKQFIAYGMDDQYFAPGTPFVDKGCAPTANRRNPSWDVCGFDGGGRCYNSTCIYPISGKFANDALAIAGGGPSKVGFRKIIGSPTSGSSRGFTII